MCLTPWSISARTIIAAPVISLGSWLLLSLMAGSGCALFGATLSVDLENKKGPKRPHAHRPVLGWPQPAPAVRLGTTRIRSLVILLRILPLGLSKGCAEHTGQTWKVKGKRPIALSED